VIRDLVLDTRVDQGNEFFGALDAVTVTLMMVSIFLILMVVCTWMIAIAEQREVTQKTVK